MNNLVILQGVASQVEVDFDAFDRKYCNFKLAIARKSGIMDILNCEIHSDSEFFTNGNYVRITGRVRCRGIRMGGKIECDMYVECDDVEVTTQWDDTNNVYLSGTLSKVGDLRLTPQSHREIIDFAVRVNNVGVDYLAELFEKYEDAGTVLAVYHGEKNGASKAGEGIYSSYTEGILERAEQLERLHGK